MGACRHAACLRRGRIFRLNLYYKPDFRRAYDSDNYGRRVFKVLTYNIRGFYLPRSGWQEEHIAGFLGEQEPDIICFQEFDHQRAAGDEAFAQLAGRYRMTLGNRTEEQNRAERGGQQAIFSKFRILRSGTIIPRTSIWADLLVGDDTVRVFNNHLHSTEITPRDAKYLTSHRYVSDTAREEKLRSIMYRLRKNSVLRAEQVDTIRSVMAATPYPMIVCGDFNDTPMSFVYRQMSRGFNDAFRKCGHGYSYTFRGFSIRCASTMCSAPMPLRYAPTRFPRSVTRTTSRSSYGLSEAKKTTKTKPI